jgi:hypothetical protein
MVCSSSEDAESESSPRRDNVRSVWLAVTRSRTAVMEGAGVSRSASPSKQTQTWKESRSIRAATGMWRVVLVSKVAPDASDPQLCQVCAQALHRAPSHVLAGKQRDVPQEVQQERALAPAQKPRCGGERARAPRRSTPHRTSRRRNRTASSLRRISAGAASPGGNPPRLLAKRCAEQNAAPGALTRKPVPEHRTRGCASREAVARTSNQCSRRTLRRHGWCRRRGHARSTIRREPPAAAVPPGEGRGAALLRG